MGTESYLSFSKDDWVIVYHAASETEPDKYPEGWYQDTYAEVVHSLQKDKSGIGIIVNAIRKAGKDVHFTDMSWLYTPMELDAMEWIDL